MAALPRWRLRPMGVSSQHFRPPFGAALFFLGTYSRACFDPIESKHALGSLEPIQKVVESGESVVIPCLAPASLPRGARCGSLNTAVPPNVTACAIRVI